MRERGALIPNGICHALLLSLSFFFVGIGRKWVFLLCNTRLQIHHILFKNNWGKLCQCAFLSSLYSFLFNSNFDVASDQECKRPTAVVSAQGSVQPEMLHLDLHYYPSCLRYPYWLLYVPCGSIAKLWITFRPPPCFSWGLEKTQRRKNIELPCAHFYHLFWSCIYSVVPLYYM